MKTPANLAAGASAEDTACAYLRQHGLRLVERNYRCRRGEIDLVMRDTEYLVFVEVRFRRSARFGSAAETISAAKRNRIAATAAHYLQRLSKQPPCRFDVFTIGGQNARRIEWIKDAFRV